VASWALSLHKDGLRTARNNPYKSCLSNNSNNTIDDNIYSAVIMAEFTRFMRRMQTQCQMAVSPQTMSADWDCEPKVM